MTGWIFGSKSCACLDNEIVDRLITIDDLPEQDPAADEPFEWLGIAGEGGLGRVYKAKDRKLGRVVAVKIMQQDLEDPRAAETFLREAQASSKLCHPNVVTISDFGLMKDGRYFLTLEWIDGITLSEYLERHGHLLVEAAVEIFCQILDGLSHAHNRDVIHRDIKPNNIMLGRTTFGGWMVKVIDFGTAKEIRHDGYLTRAEDMMCSPYYVSPERVNGLFVDQRADLYSLGCTLFEALTGRPPFSGEALPVVMKHLNETPPTLSEAANGKEFPDYLERMVAKLLAKSPDDRFTDAEETRKALEEESIKETVFQVACEQAVTSTQTKRRSVPRPVAALALGAVLIACPLSALFFLSHQNDGKQSSEQKRSEVHLLNYPATTAAHDPLSEVNQVNKGITGFGTSRVVLGDPDKADFLQLKKSVGAEKIVLDNCVHMPNDAFSQLACGKTLKRIEFDESSNLNPKALPPLQNYPNPLQISFRFCMFSPEFLTALARLGNLQYVDIRLCTFKTDAIASLSATPKLTILKVTGSSMTCDERRKRAGSARRNFAAEKLKEGISSCRQDTARLEPVNPIAARG